MRRSTVWSPALSCSQWLRVTSKKRSKRAPIGGRRSALNLYFHHNQLRRLVRFDSQSRLLPYPSRVASRQQLAVKADDTFDQEEVRTEPIAEPVLQRPTRIDPGDV